MASWGYAYLSTCRTQNSGVSLSTEMCLSIAWRCCVCIVYLPHCIVSRHCCRLGFSSPRLSPLVHSRLYRLLCRCAKPGVLRGREGKEERRSLLGYKTMPVRGEHYTRENRGPHDESRVLHERCPALAHCFASLFCCVSFPCVACLLPLLKARYAIAWPRRSGPAQPASARFACRARPRNSWRPSTHASSPSCVPSRGSRPSSRGDSRSKNFSSSSNRRDCNSNLSRRSRSRSIVLAMPHFQCTPLPHPSTSRQRVLLQGVGGGDLCASQSRMILFSFLLECQTWS